ncbi:MAG: GDSL-type esterase/lipase family protein [Oscillospiraceae bacterium]|nr:GDSL-type esterase/lipase family protein [Oscillospiraceae bacterium]
MKCDIDVDNSTNPTPVPKKNSRRAKRRKHQFGFLLLALILVAVAAAALLSSPDLPQVLAGPQQAYYPPEALAASEHASANPSGQSSGDSKATASLNTAEADATSDQAETQESVLTPAGGATATPSPPPAVITQAPVPDEIAVAASAEAEDSYFAQSAFIGDSRTVGLMISGRLSQATFLASVGMNVSKFFTETIDLGSGTESTIADALKTQPYDKIYLAFGINEYDWPNKSEFIREYLRIVQYIQGMQPDAVIYIQSILPVTYAYEQEHSGINQTLADLNALLMQLCQNTSTYYLDVAQSLSDDYGRLPAEASSDGVHLTSAYLAKWTDYLKTHTVP